MEAALIELTSDQIRQLEATIWCAKACAPDMRLEHANCSLATTQSMGVRRSLRRPQGGKSFAAWKISRQKTDGIDMAFALPDSRQHKENVHE